MSPTMTLPSGSHGRYLSLALGARRIIDELIDLLEKDGQSQTWRETVRHAIDAIDSAADIARERAVQPRLALSHYEHVHTLDEVRPSHARAALISSLEDLVSRDSLNASAIEVLYQAMDFFTEVEARALFHYRQRPGSTWALARA